jgi:predicted nucleic acid-binding protein
MDSNNSLICDTNVLVYFFTGNAAAGKVVSQYNVVVSAITAIELLSSSRQSSVERELVKDFLSGITSVHTNPYIVDLAINFRLSYSLLVPDAVIVATAKYLEMPLVTSDTELFKIKEIEIIKFTK